MELLRLAISIVGGASGVLVVWLLLAERQYPARQPARFIAPIVAAGAMVIAHIALYVVDRDPAWLLGYSLGFVLWGVLAVPVAVAVSSHRMRKERRLKGW